MPNKWSRVVTADDTSIDDLTEWTVADDIEDETNSGMSRPKRLRKEWAPLFITEDFLSKTEAPTLEAFALKDRKLRMLGERVTLARQRFT